MQHELEQANIDAIGNYLMLLGWDFNISQMEGSEFWRALAVHKRDNATLAISSASRIGAARRLYQYVTSRKET